MASRQSDVLDRKLKDTYISLDEAIQQPDEIGIPSRDDSSAPFLYVSFSPEPTE